MYMYPPHGVFLQYNLCMWYKNIEIITMLTRIVNVPFYQEFKKVGSFFFLYGTANVNCYTCEIVGMLTARGNTHLLTRCVCLCSFIFHFCCVLFVETELTNSRDKTCISLWMYGAVAQSILGDLDLAYDHLDKGHTKTCR